MRKTEVNLKDDFDFFDFFFQNSIDAIIPSCQRLSVRRKNILLCHLYGSYIP